MTNVWKSTLTFTVASVLLAGTAFAQGTPGGAGPEKAETPPAQAAQPGTPMPEAGQPLGTPPTGTTKSTDAIKSGDKMGTLSKSMGGQKDVRMAQEALKAKGHDPGPIDGIMGPRTSAALKEFQKSQGLRETGRLDTETRGKLGV